MYTYAFKNVADQIEYIVHQLFNNYKLTKKSIKQLTFVDEISVKTMTLIVDFMLKIFASYS